MELDDEWFMAEALLEAQKAYDADEVPVGAVVVWDHQILTRAHNRVESSCDASAHAELLALKEAASLYGNWRLSEMTLYSTLEPCSMCAGALLSFRIGRLVWGAPDIRQGADGSWIPLLGNKHPIHSIVIRRGVLEEQASALMRSFFQNKRGKYAGASF